MPGKATMNKNLAGVSPVTEQPLDADSAENLAAVLKALADPVRLRLFSHIASQAPDEVCVCDLLSWFDLTQATISHHLKVLKKAELLISERRATWVYYRLVPGTLAKVNELLGGRAPHTAVPKPLHRTA